MANKKHNEETKLAIGAALAETARNRPRPELSIIVALWGKTLSELTSAEEARYRRLAKTTSYYRRHEKNKVQQRKDKSWRKVKILQVLGWEAACAKCGYDKYIGALDFHHIDPATKVSEVLDMPYEDAIDEARKCELICKNCHAELHAEMRASGDKTHSQGGRPKGPADPLLAEYMRLSGLSEETICAAHAGRPGEDKQMVLREDKQIVREIGFDPTDMTCQRVVCLSCLQAPCMCGRLADGTVCEEAEQAKDLAHFQGRLATALSDTHRRSAHSDTFEKGADGDCLTCGRFETECECRPALCKTSQTTFCTCPPNGICNDCRVPVSEW